MSRTPWLILGTALGAFFGFLFLPAEVGAGPRDLERFAWMSFRIVWWAVGGLSIGLAIDAIEACRSHRK